MGIDIEKVEKILFSIQGLLIEQDILLSELDKRVDKMIERDSIQKEESDGK